MFEAQAHIYKHTFNYANSMALSSALRLNIPDIIHAAAGKPVTLPHLASALHLPPAKHDHLRRLMRLLTHNGFFRYRSTTDDREEEEKGYVLTASSRLLVKGQVPNLSPFVRVHTEPDLMTPFQFLGDWFSGNAGEEVTPFEMAHGGVPLWKLCGEDPRLNNAFNEAMLCNSEMQGLGLGDCGPVFEGLATVTDVGGGTGMFAKLVVEAFPGLECTVFDLPHVVAGLQPPSDNLRFVGGDMFDSIPSSDAIILKHIMHNWSDENCLKILKKCKEAITSNNGVIKGKVIIIDIVMDEKGKEDGGAITEMKFMFDVLMMVYLNARERTEKEWERMFIEAGFSGYHISHVFGIWSLIEMCGKTRLDRISNEVIPCQVGMAPVEDKLRKARLRWFGHVRRRDADAPVRRCERITVIGGSRGRGRPMKNWKEVIRQYLGLLDLTEDMALDRNLWKTRIRVAG
ncbi:unnamed protein product [Cuscuta campestris]|uniref:Myricetin 7/4'-O-methyltransferase 2 n=1 Tax=Cuscuta campestris TaxID=132261 RepID=A0A484LHU3_9ASTE|nr:unnamed protein product [Cuscuta campestris]